MIPSKAVEIYNSLLEIVKEFKSPAYKNFFIRKANEDFSTLKNVSENGKKSCVVDKYIEEQKDLIDVMKRQTVIYNMFYDEKSGI
ncbi:hypothetical protein NBO_65g0007 [Nosema bombycis CQ1]|uniref:Uncharacterized protein n=1 Tax=Nosema bombycis (strain CQ1 / CVCC 102059) TaxID=578461 RepID=R0MLA0_NOSB1|nr:hypothetical protein NBO_65g0007 [Nosema bombycis CQ1]|eukprot:EOB13603.1 hypothetical protein NBO_65g0007 [Nosema bombycis CQ1]